MSAAPAKPPPAEIAERTAAPEIVPAVSAPSASPPPKPALHPAVEDVLAKLKQAVKTSRRAALKADQAVAQREDEYITATWTHGNLMRGWDSYARKVDRNPTAGSLSAAAAPGGLKQRKVRPTDRMFSMTSGTSSVRAEVGAAEAAGRKGGVKKKSFKKK